MMGYWANEGNMNILNNSLNILSKGAKDNLIKNEVERFKIIIKKKTTSVSLWCELTNISVLDTEVTVR